MPVPKRITVRTRDLEMKADIPVSEESMARRRQIAAMIRERMAIPPTEVERELWEELKGSIRNRRSTIS